MIILAIETSCDETSCAIIKKNKILSNFIFSQSSEHNKYGGVYPEMASRMHLEKIDFVISKSLKIASLQLKDIDLIAVTQGPGLSGSLHIGVIAAKTLSWILNIPIVPVDHIQGHIYSNILVKPFIFPLLALVISGGHTEFVYMKKNRKFKIIGKTNDDAIGEAYDKVSRILGLGYPGGPIIDKLAKKGKNKYFFPYVNTSKKYDFSFSGLKTFVYNLVLNKKKNNKKIDKNNIAYGFQKRVTQIIKTKILLVLKKYPIKTFVIAGGVAANSSIRNLIFSFKKKYNNINFLFPPMWACVDQAAMIGLTAYQIYKNKFFFNIINNKDKKEKLNFSVLPNRKVSSLLIYNKKNK